MKESAHNRTSDGSSREESGAHHRLETGAAHEQVAESLARLRTEYADDTTFDPRLAIMTAREHGKRESADLRVERQEFATKPIWTRDTAKELRKPYEVRRGKELAVWDERIKATEGRTQKYTEMLTALEEGDASKADAYFAPLQAEAEEKLREYQRDLRIAQSAAKHPEARVDWTNLENLTRMAEAAERNVRHAQRALKTITDKRQFLALLAETK